MGRTSGGRSRAVRLRRTRIGDREERSITIGDTAPSPPSEGGLRGAVVRACNRLVELGINAGTAGNVGVRFGSRTLVTPSGIPYDEMRPEQLAEIDDAGAYRGPCKPTSEWRLHTAILRARPEIGAVVHTHSTYATAVASLRRDLPAVHYYIATAAGGPTVRCAAYATFGTPELSENALAALEGRFACLLANHGLVVLGTTLADAVRRTHDLEIIAQQYVLAVSIGTPVILPDDEIARVARYLSTYGSQRTNELSATRRDEPFAE